MYRNMNPGALGVSGRQSEILEIALTYRFKGIDVDLGDLVKRSKTSSVENACKYLVSAKVKIGGSEAPVRWRGAEADFKADLADLSVLGEVAKALGADRVHTTVHAHNDTLPLQDNFKFHTDRLTALAEALGGVGLKLAIGFQAAPQKKEGGHEFIRKADGLLQLLSGIHSKHAGLLLDVWNWHVGGGKLDQIKPAQVLSVRLADLLPEVNLAEVTDQDRSLPGDGGAVDAGAILQMLEQANYEGPVSPFPHPTQFTGRTRESNVMRAATALDNLWNSAGLKGAVRPPAAAPTPGKP